MKQTDYPGSITGSEFEQIKPCLPVKRRSKWNLLDIVNAIFYVCAQGIKWRALPHDFGPPWQTVYWYFSKWSGDGSWSAINEQLVLIRRQTRGSAPLPSILVIDSQSVKNAATATRSTAVYGGKKIKGRKRLLLSDNNGDLLAARVVAANLHDGPAAAAWWGEELARHPFFEQVRLIRGDRHFGGRFKTLVEQEAAVKVEVSHGLVEKRAQQMMAVHKGRWVVERTIASADNSRRLSKD